jgi:hypothetical protein
VSAPADERLGAPDDRLGLFATVAIAVGGIVGIGIFTVPAAIADYGWLSAPAFAVAGAVLRLPALNNLVGTRPRAIFYRRADALGSASTSRRAPAPARGCGAARHGQGNDRH